MEILIKLAWAVLPSLLVGAVLFVFQQKMKSRDNEYEIRRQWQVKEDLLRIDIMFANCNLIRETAISGKRGVWNGEVDKALQKQDEAVKAYNEFVNQMHQDTLNKK